jgi:opacity protein-like surface antigen
MNKLITGVVVGLVMGACSAVSALDASAGGGAYLGYDIVGMGIRSDFNTADGTLTHAIGVPQTIGGLHAYFDASFVEVGIGLGFGTGKWSGKLLLDGEEHYVEGWTNISTLDYSFTTFEISMLGKYNVPVREGMEVFPAIGVEYSLCITADSDDKTDKKRDATDYSQFLIKLGVGYDYALSGNVYIRVLALYGIGLPNKFSRDQEDIFKDKDFGLGKGSYEAATTSNITIKAGIGFKF